MSRSLIVPEPFKPGWSVSWRQRPLYRVVSGEYLGVITEDVGVRRWTAVGPLKRKPRRGATSD